MLCKLSMKSFFLGIVSVLFSLQCMNHCRAVLRDELLDRGVIVRVWSSALNGGQSVGHVSLETRNRYMSLWPDDKEGGPFNLSLQDDLRDEGERDPEITIPLPHPDPESLRNMEENFDFLMRLSEKGKLQWALDGDRQFLKDDLTEAAYERGASQSILMEPREQDLWGVYETWSFNCSSFVFNLLRNNRYVKEDAIKVLTVTTTPDQVAAKCAMEFLYLQYGMRSGGDLFNILREELALEKFGSRHVELLGMYRYRSKDEQVIENNSEMVKKRVAKMIEQEKEESGWVTFARALNDQGMLDALAASMGSASAGASSGGRKK